MIKFYHFLFLFCYRDRTSKTEEREREREREERIIHREWKEQAQFIHTLLSYGSFQSWWSVEINDRICRNYLDLITQVKFDLSLSRLMLLMKSRSCYFFICFLNFQSFYLVEILKIFSNSKIVWQSVDTGELVDYWMKLKHSSKDQNRFKRLWKK